jgi:ferredoxin
MDFDSLIEGAVLRIVFIIFFSAIVARLIFFITSIIKNSIDKKSGLIDPLSIFGRFFAPFHRAFLKKPVYSSLRYIFHLCLFVVPIWYAAHISYWEESSLAWTWTSIPDEWADWMTLLVMAFAIFFIIRHFATKELRAKSSFKDYIIVFLTAFPFFTGYCWTHGTLDSIPFIEDNIQMIHVLSGEMMIVAAAFLLCRTRMDRQKCTGCASCVLSCPTGTLESRDAGNLRIFAYSHYQCISCGACVNTCPEGAAELRHEINLKRFFHFFTKEDIRNVELESCKNCGKLFMPEPLMEKIHKTFTDAYIELCPDCRKVDVGVNILRFSPRHHKMKRKTELGTI